MPKIPIGSSFDPSQQVVLVASDTQEWFALPTSAVAEMEIFTRILPADEDGGDALSAPVPLLVCAAALADVCTFCELTARTTDLRARVRENSSLVVVLRAAVTQQEWAFLTSLHPLGAVGRLVELLAVCDYLAFPPLSELLAAYMAHLLSGKSTEQMRLFLGVPPNTDERSLFDEDTWHRVQLEREWAELLDHAP
jgi:hypothetical protein